MASTTLQDAEKIVRMTEWNEHEVWEYSDQDHSPEQSSLEAAKRFLAAQSYLLSWQQGKIAVGCRRGRRLTDFAGVYPQAVIDDAEYLISERVALKNFKTTARLNALGAKGKPPGRPDKNKTRDDAALNKQEIEALKDDFSAFSHDFFEAKSALNKATTAIADLSFRVQAVSELVE